MRHLRAGRRLGVSTSHRKAMLRNMVTSLLEKEQIVCTLARAKEMRKPLENMITWGKQAGTPTELHARRQALQFVKSKEAMQALFGPLAERYKDRKGGYSRIIKLAERRLGDGAEMAIIQLVGSPKDVLSATKTKKAPKAAPAQNSSVLQQVNQEVAQ